MLSLNISSQRSFQDQSQVLKEVFRIKDILANPDESDSKFHNCLRRLDLMQLTLETLEATKIGKQVNQLCKHNSKEIRSTVKKLISGWKELLDEWLKTTGNVAGAASAGTLDSVSPATAEDENGLPSPPLDEGTFRAIMEISTEISQIFDDLDDGGNSRDAEKSKNNEYDAYEKQCTVERLDKITQSAHPSNLTRASSPCGKQEINKERGEMKMNAKIQPGKDCQGHRISSSSRIIASCGPGRHPQKSKSPDDASAKVRLEAAKRRLREGYQQAENAKKQRMVQVIESQDLLKEGPKPFHGRPVSQHYRRWMNNHRS